MAWLSPWTCVGAGTLGAWDIGLSCSWSSEVPAKYYPTQRGTAALVWVYSCGAAQLYPSRSCGFTQCCARRRRHRERCQVFSGPNRFFPNRYQSQFDMSIPCSNGPLSRQYDFNFITAFLHISGCFSGPNRFFPNRYQSQFDMCMPCSNGPPSRQNDFLFITAFLHTLGCFSGPTRLSPLDFCIGPRWLRLVHCKYNRNGICSAMAVLLDA